MSENISASKSKKAQAAANIIYRYRYLIILLIFGILVACRLSGSSIGAWCAYFGVDDMNRICGEARSARSDEWGTLTALNFGQKWNLLGAYNRYSRGINGTLIDNMIIYGAPAWDILTIFRPYYWGYLLFGSSAGLSWYWCWRQLALLMSVFEFGMLIARRNRWISCMLAVAVGFAPFLQWWFSVNGLVEVLIFGCYFCVGANYLRQRTYSRKKYAVAVGMVICAGGYIVTFYPTWMIPIGWSFVPALVWIFLRRTKREKTKKDIYPWIVVVGLFALSMLYLWLSSRDTIKAVLNGSYPKLSTISGGGSLGWMLKYPFSLFQIVDSYSPIENSSVICFAPLGIIVGIMAMIKRRRCDMLLVLSMLVELLLSIYCAFGLPLWLSRITLLGMCGTNRMTQVLGFLRLFILARAMSLKTMSIRLLIAAPIAAAASAAVMCFSWKYQFVGGDLAYNYWENIGLMIGVAIVLFVIFMLVISLNKGLQWIPAMLISTVVLLSALNINPIEQSAAAVTDNSLINTIASIAKTEPDAVFAVVDDNYPASNIPAMAGAVCVNTTQTYAQPERWSVIDPEGRWMDCYNRYCHINVHIGAQTNFELVATDSISVTLDSEDLKALGVKYLLYRGGEDLNSLAQYGINAVKLFQFEAYSIWQVQ